MTTISDDTELKDMISAPITTRDVLSRDGTRIRYYVAGRGRYTLVLAPGLGANMLCWKHIFEGFQGVFTMYTWDPRGTYGSAVPADMNRLRLVDHVNDFEAIRRDARLRRFHMAGWSMGVQIALEHTWRNPETVRSLALLNGAYGHLLRSVLDIDGIEPVLSVAIKLGRLVARPLGPAVGKLFSLSFVPRVLIATRLLADRNINEFSDILAKFSTLDWFVYLRLMQLLNEHTAEPYLSKIDVPTLVTVGSKDLITPPSIGRHLARSLPNAQLSMIPGGTHYSMMEYPELVHQILERWYKRVDPIIFD